MQTSWSGSPHGGQVSGPGQGVYHHVSSSLQSRGTRLSILTPPDLLHNHHTPSTTATVSHFHCTLAVYSRCGFWCVYLYVYLYVYIYICVCVCVCVSSAPSAAWKALEGCAPPHGRGLSCHAQVHHGRIRHHLCRSSTHVHLGGCMPAKRMGLFRALATGWHCLHSPGAFSWMEREIVGVTVGSHAPLICTSKQQEWHPISVHSCMFAWL